MASHVPAWPSQNYISHHPRCSTHLGYTCEQEDDGKCSSERSMLAWMRLKFQGCPMAELRLGEICPQSKPEEEMQLQIALAESTEEQEQQMVNQTGE
ncbi:UNVERIFIED_CONTAM: hypothetical protein FKN15_023903 [Acipenser sinensis]